MINRIVARAHSPLIRPDCANEPDSYERNSAACEYFCGEEAGRPSRWRGEWSYE